MHMYTLFDHNSITLSKICKQFFIVVLCEKHSTCPMNKVHTLFIGHAVARKQTFAFFIFHIINFIE